MEAKKYKKQSKPATPQPTASHLNFSGPLFKIPQEILFKTASYLDDKDWFNLRITCRFSNETLAKTRQTVPLTFKVSAGCNHIFLLSKDGNLYACGNNFYGQLGLGDLKDRSVFTRVSTKNMGSIRAIKAGNGCTFALTTKGKLYACGNNTHGQLGLGNTKDQMTFTEVPIKDIGKNLSIEQIILGNFHALLLLSNGTARGCGANFDYQLGLEHSDNQLVFTPIGINNNIPIRAIIAGAFHTILLLSNNEVYVCGNNTFGQLGLGHATCQKTFTQLSLKPIHLQSKLQQILSNKNIGIKQIAAGDDHTLIQLNNGELYGCGHSGYGQLGPEPDRLEEFSFAPILIENNIQQLIVGRSNTFFLSSMGLYACGRNDMGQLGLQHTDLQKKPTLISIKGINTPISILRVETGIAHTFLLLSNGQWYVSGASNYSVLNLTADQRNIHAFTPCNFDALLTKKAGKTKQNCRVQ